MKKQRYKWVFSMMTLVFLLVCAGSACSPEKKISRFGMDILDLKPLIITIVDHNTQEETFSRDPSNISAIISLFEGMELTRMNEKTSVRGMSFKASTMYGDFSFGEFLGSSLRVGETEYELDKDYTADINLLTERIASEGTNISEVTRERILAVRPEMTYQELLHSFGETFNTSTTNNEFSYLYKYGNRPFYIRFDRETDLVGITGGELLTDILINYNLGDVLIPPEPPLEGGRVDVYMKAFEYIVGRCKQQSSVTPTKIIIDIDRLVHIDNQEKERLIAFLNKLSPVTTDESAALFSMGDWVGTDHVDTLAVWIDEYTFIGENRMDFTVAGRVGEEAIQVQTMSFTHEDGKWKDDK